ncbi:MAG: phosphoribosylglycinamide formyltransferase [Pseudomonadota bacterium]
MTEQRAVPAGAAGDPRTTDLNLAVLISGRGSNLQALLRHQGAFRVSLVISNRPDAEGLVYAREAGVETAVIDHRLFDERADFEQALAETLSRNNLQLIVLAGFMRILGAAFVSRFVGRMINLHPSLLPDFRGLKTHERALEAGVKEHGASVHFVTPELDGGPVIAQITLPVEPEDTPQTLASRLLPLEHKLLVSVVRWFGEGRVRYANGQVCFDGDTLAQPLRVAAAGSAGSGLPGADPSGNS